MREAPLSPCLFKTWVVLAASHGTQSGTPPPRDCGSLPALPAQLSQGRAPSIATLQPQEEGGPKEGVQGGKEDLYRDLAVRSGQGG